MKKVKFRNEHVLLSTISVVLTLSVALLSVSAIQSSFALGDYEPLSEFGEFGIIERVNDQTSQPIIMVKNQKNKIIMVPLVDDFLIELNRQEKRMIFKLPEGLINL